MAARAVLSGGFAESSDGSSLLSGYPKLETPYADDYDYDSDSDLDDDDDEVDSDSGSDDENLRDCGSTTGLFTPCPLHVWGVLTSLHQMTRPRCTRQTPTNSRLTLQADHVVR